MTKRKRQNPSSCQPLSSKKKKNILSPVKHNINSNTQQNNHTTNPLVSSLNNSSTNISSIEETPINNCSTENNNESDLTGKCFTNSQINKEIQTNVNDTVASSLLDVLDVIQKAQSKENNNSDILKSIDRKLSCLIGLFTELKSKICQTSMSNFTPIVEPITTATSSHVIPPTSNTTLNDENIKSKLFLLSRNRNNIVRKLERNKYIADIYENNINLLDPLIPRKLCEKISKFDKEYLIEFKKKQSIINTKNEIEKLRLIAKDQANTLHSIDTAAFDYTENNDSFKSFWQSNILQNEAKTTSLLEKNKSFYSSHKHVVPLSFLDVSFAQRITKSSQSLNYQRFNNETKIPHLSNKRHGEISSFARTNTNGHSSNEINMEYSRNHFQRSRNYTSPRSIHHYDNNQRSNLQNSSPGINTVNTVNFTPHENSSYNLKLKNKFHQRATPLKLFPSFLEKSRNFPYKTKQ